jgi:hypothetical protein
VQTSYLIAEIVVIPLSGWLSRVMSTRWLFCVSATGFTVTSLFCGWAWDIQSMIVFRALQRFLGGSMIPTVFTTAFFYFTGQQRVIAAAVIGSLSSLAPTLGPTVGGWITDNYSWHWLFFINLAPGIFVALVVPMLVRVDRPNLSLLRGADYAGMALTAIFLGCLEYTLEEGPRHPRHRLDLRNCRHRLYLAEPDPCPASRRLARPHQPQFLARLLLLVRHRRRHFCDDLSDPPLPRSGARLQRVADRHRGIFDRRLPGALHSALHRLHQIYRFTLAADGRSGVFCTEHVELRADHA